MIKSFLIAVSTMACTTVMASDFAPVAEVCNVQNVCAFRIPFPGIEKEGLYLVTERDAEILRYEWNTHHFFIVTDEEYEAVKGQFVQQGFQSITAGQELARAGRPAPAPAPAPRPSPGGPLIGGSITVGNVTIGGGGNTCQGGGCHTPGDIHKPAKVTDGGK